MSTFGKCFTMELKHPIDEKTWDAIADTEFDNTKRIFFKTKSGKEVAFIKEDVLDQIKAKIEEGAKIIHYVNMEKAKALYWCLEVIDKYTEESEDNDD